MQYSGSSFVDPIASLLRPQRRKEGELDIPQGLFPVKGGLLLSHRDPAESILVGPLTKGLRKIFSFFWWIQIGETRLYILYGFVFLVAALIFILGGRP